MIYKFSRFFLQMWPLRCIF